MRTRFLKEEFSMVSRKAASPKPKKQRAKAGKRGSTRPIRIRIDMTITDGQQRMSVIRLFYESLQASTVHGRRTSVPNGLSPKKIQHEAIAGLSCSK
jgi:hypothetical protein